MSQSEESHDAKSDADLTSNAPSTISLILGWGALLLSTAITCFWAFWGIIENFHEGWWHESLGPNLTVMFVQYLSPMLIFLALAAISIGWPRAGAVLHVTTAGLVFWLIGMGLSDTTVWRVLVPVALIAAAYWWGRPRPLRRAYALLLGATLLTLVLSGAEPVYRVLIVGRTNDGNLGARVVEGRGVRLMWAPDGPGWPRDGMNWHEAVEQVRHLSADGLRLEQELQDIWRLPTADEVVRSQTRHGENCQGEWDGKSPFPKYKIQPDKETPLWNVHSQVIYWWTGTEIDDKYAYMCSYNGHVRPRKKTFGPEYYGFRAVKDPPDGQ